MKTLILTALVLVFASFTLFADVVSSDTFPVALVVNPATCPLVPPNTGIINGSGVLTIAVRTTESGNGGLHVGVHVNGHGTATDQTGGKWVWSDADIFEPGSINSNGDTFEATIVEGFHLIGPRGKKIIVNGVFHLTIVDGIPRVEVVHGNETVENEACEGFIF